MLNETFSVIFKHRAFFSRIFLFNIHCIAGLRIPEGNTKTQLRVADKYLEWQDGEMFIFDDSFDHEVWHFNNKDKPRMVLILDLWHPELSSEKRLTLPAI